MELDTNLIKPSFDTKGIDWPWIQYLEGEQQLEGYWPQNQKSGVTVATGFDLGQYDKYDIKALHFPESLEKKLLQYVGVKGEGAEKILKVKPLTLRPWEADAIDEKLFLSIYERIEKYYNDAQRTNREGVREDERTKGEPLFGDLPLTAKTVVFSLAWNFGPSFRNKAPIAWWYILNGDWENLIRELNNFYKVSIRPFTLKGLIARRKKEAQYLNEMVKLTDEEATKEPDRENLPKYVKYKIKHGRVSAKVQLVEGAIKRKEVEKQRLYEYQRARAIWAKEYRDYLERRFSIANKEANEKSREPMT